VSNAVFWLAGAGLVGLGALGVALWRRQPEGADESEFDAVFVARQPGRTRGPQQPGHEPERKNDRPDDVDNDPDRPAVAPVDTASAPPTAPDDRPVATTVHRTDVTQPSDAAGEASSTADEPARHADPDVVQRLQPNAPAWTGELSTGGTGAVWAEDAPGLTRVALWMERRAAMGEDAPPTTITAVDSPIGLVAVYDGVGGSGAGLVGVGDDGEAHTGAWLASRVVRAATEDWFVEEVSRRTADVSESLRTTLTDRLTDEMHQVAGSSRLAGTLRRDLPTTLAAAAFRIQKAGEVRVASLWVGDSRVFVLTPSAGLQQLSVDDSPATDALAALVDDPPMSNVISASGAFSVNARRRTFTGPLVVLAATDGCFGYVATPAHFELLVLRSLAASEDPTSWMTALLADTQAITSDDASFAAVAIGFADHGSLRDAFAPRLAQLEADHWAPFEAIDHTDHGQLSAFRQQSWSSYRSSYEEHQGVTP
jgi:hypothetical protein